MKVDLDELTSIIDSRLSDVRAKIAELDRHQTRLQEQRAQVMSIRTMVEELLGAIRQDKELAHSKVEKSELSETSEKGGEAAEKDLSQKPAAE